MAYRKARENGSYDALLVNRSEYITEGSRTNFFCVDKTAIVTPNEDGILLGVMRKVVLKVAEQNNIEVICKDIRLGDIKNYDAAFVTSTSSKIMPVRSIDNISIGPLSSTLDILIKKCNQYLSDCVDGKMS
jgi:branched-subunit amino acid aminotransferase/4-amino-4-deoxychorismate lyase